MHTTTVTNAMITIVQRSSVRSGLHWLGPSICDRRLACGCNPIWHQGHFKTHSGEKSHKSSMAPETQTSLTGSKSPIMHHLHFSRFHKSTKISRIQSCHIA